MKKSGTSRQASRQAPYRTPMPPRPLTEDDLPPPKPRKPMHWIPKTLLFASPAIFCAYALAWLEDHQLLRSSTGMVHRILLFIVIAIFTIVSGVSLFTKGTFR